MAKQKIEYKNISTVEEIEKKITEVSKANPSKIVTAYARFNRLTIYINNQQPRTDSPSTIQMWQEMGGFMKNGKIVRPIKAWFGKYNFCPVMR